MAELWLNFRDENGTSRRVAVGRSGFTIGRSPENDLVIPVDSLSRRHAKIEKFFGAFSICDLGSSNGTNLNGRPVFDPVDLKGGDTIDLGGGVTLTVEIAEAATEPAAPPPSESPGATAPSSSSQTPVVANSAKQSVPTAWLLVIPLLGIFAFVCAGGGYFLLKKESVPQGRSTPSPDDDSDVAEGDEGPRKSAASPTPDALPSPPPQADVSSDVKKAERNASLFLRRVAGNDPTAFITSKQAETVSMKIIQLKGSQGLAENLKAAKKAAGEFETMASSQGLKGAFLAAAALTKLGQAKGDPVETARAMLPILGELRRALGNSLGDDNLLIIADFLRREANRKPSLQTTLEAISKSKSGINPREIRTIWFLKENGKISDESFDFSLRFLAVGSIMQNPKDFGVDSDPF